MVCTEYRGFDESVIRGMTANYRNSVAESTPNERALSPSLCPYHALADLHLRTQPFASRPKSCGVEKCPHLWKFKGI